MGPIGVGGGADPAEADAATAGCADEGGGNNGGGGKRQGLDGAGPSMERHLSGTLGDEGEAAHGGQKGLSTLRHSRGGAVPCTPSPGAPGVVPARRMTHRGEGSELGEQGRTKVEGGGGVATCSCRAERTIGKTRIDQCLSEARVGTKRSRTRRVDLGRRWRPGRRGRRGRGT